MRQSVCTPLQGRLVPAFNTPSRIVSNLIQLIAQISKMITINIIHLTVKRQKEHKNKILFMESRSNVIAFYLIIAFTTIPQRSSVGRPK